MLLRQVVILVGRMRSSGQADATTARTILSSTDVGAVMVQSKCLVDGEVSPYRDLTATREPDGRDFVVYLKLGVLVGR